MSLSQIAILLLAGVSGYVTGRILTPMAWRGIWHLRHALHLFNPACPRCFVRSLRRAL